MPALPPDRSHIVRSPGVAQPSAALGDGSLDAGWLAAWLEGWADTAGADADAAGLLQAAAIRTATTASAGNLSRSLIRCSSSLLEPVPGIFCRDQCPATGLR